MANDAPHRDPLPVPLPGGVAPPSVAVKPPIVYPESDGKPMADNTKQARWIFVLFGNLSALYRDRADVFVAADLFWYAREGDPAEVTAPDVMVAFGPPKGDRRSYKQWEEGDVPCHVVFEVLSPGNRDDEMARKYHFYEEHGVEEYYIYDPDDNKLEVYLRRGSVFRRENKADSYISRRMGVRFVPGAGPEMSVSYPNGNPFLSFEELAKRYDDAKKRADDAAKRADDAAKRADGEKQRADDAAKRADDAAKRADGEKQRADDAAKRADGEKQRADDAAKRAEALQQQATDLQQLKDDHRKHADDVARRSACLAKLGRKARRGQATAEELAELERLEDQAAPPAP